MTAKTFYVKLVLVEHIADHEAEGWTRRDDKIHVALGGWASVWMRKGGNDDKKTLL